MMIEPPAYFGGTGVFKIHDSVFVAIEMGFVEERAGAMQQSGEDEINVLSNALPVETGKQRSRTRSVKTFIVIKNFDFQSMPQSYKSSRHQNA